MYVTLSLTDKWTDKLGLLRILKQWHVFYPKIVMLTRGETIQTFPHICAITKKIKSIDFAQIKYWKQV